MNRLLDYQCVKFKILRNSPLQLLKNSKTLGAGLLVGGAQYNVRLTVSYTVTSTHKITVNYEYDQLQQK